VWAFLVLIGGRHAFKSDRSAAKKIIGQRIREICVFTYDLDGLLKSINILKFQDQLSKLHLEYRLEIQTQTKKA